MKTSACYIHLAGITVQFFTKLSLNKVRKPYMKLLLSNLEKMSIDKKIPCLNIEIFIQTGQYIHLSVSYLTETQGKELV